MSAKPLAKGFAPSAPSPTPRLRAWRVDTPGHPPLNLLALTRQEALLTAHELCGPHTTVRPATDW